MTHRLGDVVALEKVGVETDPVTVENLGKIPNYFPDCLLILGLLYLIVT